MAIDMNNFSTNQEATKQVYSDKKMRIGIIGTGGVFNYAGVPYVCGA